MKQFAPSDLISRTRTLNEVNVFRGIVHEDGIEHCKYTTYFGVLNAAIAGKFSYETSGHIFGLNKVSQQDIDDVISWLKNLLLNCLIKIDGKYHEGSGRYIGFLTVKWDQVYE